MPQTSVARDNPCSNHNSKLPRSGTKNLNSRRGRRRFNLLVIILALVQCQFVMAWSAINRRGRGGG